MSKDNKRADKGALQKGAKLLNPPIKKTTGGYIEQVYDASVRHFGITWLRVKNGLGGRGDREDWVADLPAVSLSVHDYHWNGEDFGPNHGSFIGALKAEMRLSLDYSVREQGELRKQAAGLEKGIANLRAAIAKAEGRAS